MATLADYETFKSTMSKEEIIKWFQKKLGRAPEMLDYYKTAKDFYQLGSYSRSLMCLQQYVSIQGATVAGRHLLGYCYLNLGESERALREFKKCIKEGYHEDWQLVVELTIELELKRRETNIDIQLDE